MRAVGVTVLRQSITVQCTGTIDIEILAVCRLTRDTSLHSYLDITLIISVMQWDS